MPNTSRIGQRGLGRPRPVFRPENIPVELRASYRWVCWYYTWSRTKRKWDKPPRRIDGTLASSMDAASWCGFARAVHAAKMRPEVFDGIGYVLGGSDTLSAVDLDHCIPNDRTDAVREGQVAGIDDWARSIVAALDSYTEISPSGHGLRILVRGSLPKESGNRKRGFEIYDHGRYVTLTGDHVDGTPRSVEPRQPAINEVVARMLPAAGAHVAFARATVVLPDDAVLLRRARSAPNGARFESLFDRGDLRGYDDDHSRADLALCSMLAFWCGNDVVRIDHLFRRSRLYREKWDERRRSSGETYGELTIAKALC